MLGNLYNILEEILGESKQGSYSSDIFQYQFNCICCAEREGDVDDKFNLEVTFKDCLFSKGGLFHCWKCASEAEDMHGGILKLIKKYGTPSQFQRYKNELSDIRKLRLYDIDAFSGLTEENTETELNLPNGCKPINLKSCSNKSVVEYLTKRKITQDIIDRYNIQYTDYSEKEYYWKNKIIVPSYDVFGELNYFVGRDYSGKAKAKYKNCDADKKDIIFQESLINWDAPIILVEGVFDALYKPNTVSMLGKSLTKDSYLYEVLLKKANAGVIICIDSDTEINESKKIFRILNTGRLKGKIKYIRLTNYKDFGEVYENEGKQGIINTIRSATVFEEIDLVFE